MNKKQKLGQYFSTTNIFHDKPFKIWSDKIPNWKTQSILEPFAGACDILNYFPNREWKCFDIDPIKENVEYSSDDKTILNCNEHAYGDNIFKIEYIELIIVQGYRHTFILLLNVWLFYFISE